MRTIRTMVFILLSLTFFLPNAVSYEIAQEKKTGYGKHKVISPEQVNSVIFHIYQVSQNFGQYTYNGYILFKDRSGEYCAVNSNNKLYIGVGDDDEPSRSKSGIYDYYREVIVGPSAFKVMKLKTGESVLGIPLQPFTIKFRTEAYDTRKANVLPKVKMFWNAERKGPIKKQVRPYAPY